MWMAYQATKDPLYLRSLRAIISHMTYSQWCAHVACYPCALAPAHAKAHAHAHAHWSCLCAYGTRACAFRDNLAEPRAFGGGDEGTNIPCDVINGFGANFWPETTGQGIAVLEMMAQKVAQCE